MTDSSVVRAPSENRRPLWVLDTNVILDWLVFADPHVRVLAQMIESGQAELITGLDCRAELAHVLAYETLRSGTTQREQAFVRFDHFARVFSGSPRSEALPRCHDTTDQKFLELARDAKADWLITKDRMLLKLAARIRRLGLFEIFSPMQAQSQCHAFVRYASTEIANTPEGA